MKHARRKQLIHRRFRHGYMAQDLRDTGSRYGDNGPNSQLSGQEKTSDGGQGSTSQPVRMPGDADGAIQTEHGELLTKDATFSDQGGVSVFHAQNGEEKPDGLEQPKERRAKRLQGKLSKTEKKLEQAEGRLPKEKQYRLRRAFDEATGEASYVLEAVERPALGRKGRLPSRAFGAAGRQAAGELHRKVSEAEKENIGVESAHKVALLAEDAARAAAGRRRGKSARLARKATRLERKKQRILADLGYREFLSGNPQLSGNALRRMLQKQAQKRRIRRGYGEAYRKAHETGQGLAATARRAKSSAAGAARKLQEAARTKAAALMAAGIAVFLLVLAAGIPSSGAALAGGISTVMAGSFQSEPAELDAADALLSQMEAELQRDINNAEAGFPGYDEYHYSLDEIGHDPLTLACYLSAAFVDFSLADVEDEVRGLFDAMYRLSFTPRVETRTRTVTGYWPSIDPETGELVLEPYETEEEYTVTALDVVLESEPLERIAEARLSGEAAELYGAYRETKGALQVFYSPLQMDWQGSVSSYYGYRGDPATGQTQFHRGVDIAVPVGTEVYSAQDGTVTERGFDAEYGNYIVVSNAQGYETRYTHLSAIYPAMGQEVSHGDAIGITGTTGSVTGSHLHLECLYNGEYYNPLFYFENGEGSVPGGAGSSPAAGSGMPPSETGAPQDYPDASVAALFAEAERYLGYPYVWGGSSPDTSFDCSGFVCWCLTQSGFYDMPRTTAQGIYEKCVPVDPSQAQPGDLIFFTGTYSSAGPVSHIGIYAGGGRMIHCGSPIQYSDIGTPYWQAHFYAFGRLQR